MDVMMAAVLLTGATPPGPGLTGTVISQRTVGDTDYVLRVITIPPGQSTGWHRHTGRLYGSIEQGTLSHFTATCESDGVYPAGGSIKEPPGQVHIGVNRGPVPLVLRVLYVLPAGSPLSVDAPDPGCSVVDVVLPDGVGDRRAVVEG